MAEKKIEKKTIPLGIKLISAWNIIIIALLTFPLIISLTVSFTSFGTFLAVITGVPVFILSILLLVSTVSLLKAKKWARTFQLVLTGIVAVKSGWGFFTLFILSRIVGSSFVFLSPMVIPQIISIVSAIGIFIYLLKSKKAKEFFAE